MKLAKLFVFASVSLSLTACGGDPLTEEEAKAVWPATSSTMESGRAGSSGALTGADFITLGVDADCPKGGKMKLKVSTDSLEFDSESVDFGFEIEFDNCEVEAQNESGGTDHLKMDGNVDYKLTSQQSDNDWALTWSWEGELSYEGKIDSLEIDGDCEFDMQGSVTVSDPSSADPTSVSIQYSGEWCGYEADALLTVSSS